MPVIPLKREVRKSVTELPMGVMHPRPVTTTRFNAAPLGDSSFSYKSRGRSGFASGGGGGGGLDGVEFGDAVDHVAYGFDAAESFVGDLDVEGLFDFEGDVDLVEGVDVELVEGRGQRDGVRGDALGLGDDGNTAAGDLIHGGSGSLELPSTYSDARVAVKVGVVSA